MNLVTRVLVAGCLLAVTLIGSGVLIFYVPRFKKIWDDAGTELSFPLVLLIHASSFMASYWYAVLPPIFFAAAGFVVLPTLWNAPTAERHRTL